MKLPQKTKGVTLVALSLFVGAGASPAATTIYTNNFLNKTGIVTWNDGGTTHDGYEGVELNGAGGLSAAPGDTSGSWLYSNGLDFSILLSDTLAANSTYVLSIEVGDRSGLNNGNPDLRFGLGSTPGASYLTPTISLTPATIDNGWVTWSQTFTTGAAPVGIGEFLRIDIVNQGVGEAGIANAQMIIDNLKLTAIPEPSAALLGGLGLLALLRRRR